MKKDKVTEFNMVETPASRKNLTFQFLKNYLFNSVSKINDNSFLKDLHLLTAKGEFNYLAELLADSNDIVINVTIYEENGEILREEKFGGKCLFFSMERAFDYALAFNRTYVYVGDGRRKETKKFDPNAAMEAWFNACIHNNWDKSNYPSIKIYHDYLEIESHGGIPMPFTRKQFLNGECNPINKDLFEIFKKIDFLEESGNGIAKILDEYGEKAFQFSTNSIKVVIPFRNDPYIYLRNHKYAN